MVGAAIGTSKNELLRAKKLIDCGTDILVIDTAHGHSKNVLNVLEKLKNFQKNNNVCR